MRDFEVPDWLRDLVVRIKDDLKLELWKIDIRVVAIAGSNPANMAVVRHDPNNWSATLYFRCDVEDTYEWWQTSYHELLHLKSAMLQQFVQRRLITELPADAQNLAAGLWSDLHEQTIDSLATSLANIYRDYIRKTL